jgi:hypothetical protein
MTLADMLRDLEEELLALHPAATDVLRDIDRMICDLEIGAAEYTVRDGAIVRTPN